MELQYLRVFYEVAKTGSISKASESLHVSQPSVTRSVQNLEASLGRKLFHRQSRGVVLTAEGQEVFLRSHRIFSECAAIENPRGSEQTQIRVAASENLCLHLLPKIFAKQFVNNKEISLDILSGTAEEVIRSVLNREADVGYCYHPSKTPGLSCITLLALEFWVIAPPNFFKGAPHIKELKERPFIGSMARKYSSSYAAKSLLTEAGLGQIEATHQSNSQETQVRLVEQGLGYSLMPSFLVTDSIKAKKIIRVPTAKPLVNSIYRITPTGSPWSYDFIDRGLVELLG